MQVRKSGKNMLGLVEVLNINCNMQAIKMKLFGIRSHTYGPFKTVLLVWQLPCSLNDARPTLLRSCKMLLQSWHFSKNLWRRNLMKEHRSDLRETLEAYFICMIPFANPS